MLRRMIPGTSAPRPAPGPLLRALGWTAPRLLALAEREPALPAGLLTLEAWRLQLIAFALAHLDDPLPPDAGALLLRAPLRQVVETALHGPAPQGIDRALRRFAPDGRVREAAFYRALVRLLGEPAAAKTIHHAADVGACVAELVVLPSGLHTRAAVDALRLQGVAGTLFRHALEWFARDRARCDPGMLAAWLGRAADPEQFGRRLAGLIEALPLPEAAPPARIGAARRLDSAADLRRVGRTLRNCLAGNGDYAERVDHGALHVYVWDGAEKAVCALARFGRLGWFLDEIAGPDNAVPAPPQRRLILDAFAEAGIARASHAHCLLEMASLPRRVHRRFGRDRHFEQFEDGG